MSFWTRIRDIPETWPEMERAAQQRYWDGLTLAVESAESGTAAIYLWGYVAETLLKSAGLRLALGVTPEQAERMGID